jgi:hypothetical protein
MNNSTKLCIERNKQRYKYKQSIYRVHVKLKQIIHVISAGNILNYCPQGIGKD